MTNGRHQAEKVKHPLLDACLYFSQFGFTLIEMAVVLVVIGLIILIVFPALNAVRTSSQRNATQANLQALMQATAAYAQANGCLPCPANAGFVGPAFGRVGTASQSAPSAPSCGTCSSPEGIAPFMSLGLPASTARDGWGRWITMRVDPALTGNTANFTAVVPPTKPVACTCSTPPVNNNCTPTPSTCTCSTAVNNACTPLPAGISQQGLCTAGLSTSTGAQPIAVKTLAGSNQPAAVIFVSHGSNGYGSYVASALTIASSISNGCRIPFPSVGSTCPQTLTCGVVTTSLGMAECNASNTAQFVDAPVQLNGSSTYDDILAYADRNTLVSMLGNGACQTVW